MSERDRAWFDDLWERHYAGVVAFAVRRSDRDTAADVAAEVFALAWRRRDRIPPTQEHLWLYGAARRVLANHRRGLRRGVALVGRLATESPRAVAGPEPDGSAGIVAAMRGLGERDREVLRLAAWEGLSSQEAAVVLGCRPATFDVRLHRARARLRAAMEAQSGTTAPAGARAEEVQ